MKLRLYPDPILKRRAVPLPVPLSQKTAQEELNASVERMIAIMDEEGGIGLAAPQVGWSVRLFITRIPVGQTEGDVKVYVNAEIIHAEGAEEAEEGCLSFPEIRGRVVRHTTVCLRAQTLQGETFQAEGSGLVARCWEHEIDHLDGILFISRMTPGERLRVKPALRELEEQYQERRRVRRKSRQ